MESSGDFPDQTDKFIEVILVVKKKFPLQEAESFFQFAEKYLRLPRSDLVEIQKTYTKFPDQQMAIIKSWNESQGDHGAPAKLLEILEKYEPPEMFIQENQQSNEASAYASNITPALQLLDRNPAAQQAADRQQVEAQSLLSNSPERESKPHRRLDIKGGEIGTFTYGAKTLAINKQKKDNPLKKKPQDSRPKEDFPLEKKPEDPRPKAESPAQTEHTPTKHADTEAHLIDVKVRHAIYDTDHITVNEDESVDDQTLSQQHKEKPAVLDEVSRSHTERCTDYAELMHSGGSPNRLDGDDKSKSTSTGETRQRKPIKLKTSALPGEDDKKPTWPVLDPSHYVICITMLLLIILILMMAIIIFLLAVIFFTRS